MYNMLGTTVNAIAIILGALIGALLKKGMPKHISTSMTTAVAMIVLYIGIDGVSAGSNTMVLVFSVIIGGLLGTLLELDARLQRLGEKVEEKLTKGKSKGSIAEGFVSASLLFCVGAMTIMGPLKSGLSGDHEIQYTKAILDCISAVVFASALGGVGVGLSSVSVFVLQGAITLLAKVVAPYLNDYTIGEMTCAGSVLIIILSLNLLGVTKIKIVNYLPAIFLPVIFCLFMK